MKRQNSSIDNDSKKVRRKTILDYFKLNERPLNVANRKEQNILIKSEDSDSDIEIISPTKIPKEIAFNQENEDVILIECSAFENFIYKKSTSFATTTEAQIKEETICDREEKPLSNSFELNSLFQTPPKKKVNYLFDLSRPSPYIKNISDAIKDKSFENLNDFLNVNLEHISKIKTPTKSDKKSDFKSDVHSARKELSFNDSPIKSAKQDEILNLKNQKDLTYSEINRKNFNTILDKVIDDKFNRALFNDEDWNIISAYSSLSNNAQSLFLRLFLRKNSWIKRSSIKYEQFMDNIQEILDELLNSKFLVDTNELINLEDGLYILDQNEAKEFAKKCKIKIQNTAKKKIIDSILNFVRTTTTLSFSASKISLETRKLNELKEFLSNRYFRVDMDNAKVFLRILLLYFEPMVFDKNINAVLSEKFFNLYNNSINLSTFPKYSLNKTMQVYNRREDLIFYVDACILESLINENKSPTLSEIDGYLDKAILKYEEYFKNNLKLDVNLPYFLRKLTAGQKFLRCISHCVSLLEKNRRYEEANNHLELLILQNIYCLTDRGKWYDRLITNCESHLKNEKKAYEYCIKAVEDYYVRKAIKLIIHKKLIRLAKKLKIDEFPPFPEFKITEVHISANTISKKVDLRNNVFYESNEHGFTVIKVEQVALNHYLDEFGFSNGLHSENQIFNIFFFLLFYDQIFVQDDNITDIYRFEFQKLPLDFGSDTNFDDGFYEKRKDHFEKRFNFLSELGNDALSNLIETEYEKYKSLITVVNLESIDLKHLKEIIFCINLDSLLQICRRLAEDHRFTRSGFPDLIVWNFNDKKIKAVEVKGPNDSLSEKQLLWIDFLNSVGLQTEVCYVKAKK